MAALCAPRVIIHAVLAHQASTTVLRVQAILRYIFREANVSMQQAAKRAHMLIKQVIYVNLAPFHALLASIFQIVLPAAPIIILTHSQIRVLLPINVKMGQCLAIIQHLGETNVYCVLLLA